MADWYYARGGQQLGPFPLESLQEVARSGQLAPSDLVWTEGMADWQPAGGVADLGGHFASGAPVPSGAGEYDLEPQAAVPTAPVGQPYPYDQPQQQPAPGAYAPGYPAPAGVLGYGHHAYRAAQPEYAGFWLRFCAAFVDGVITAVPGCIIGGIWGAMAASSGQQVEADPAFQLATNVLGIVIAWLYEAMFTSSAYQATPGKMLLGIRVTDMAGQRISFGRATGRHFAKFISAIILLIGYIMAAFTERKQALHDIMAGTLVTRK